MGVLTDRAPTTCRLCTRGPGQGLPGGPRALRQLMRGRGGGGLVPGPGARPGSLPLCHLSIAGCFNQGADTAAGQFAVRGRSCALWDVRSAASLMSTHEVQGASCLRPGPPECVWTLPNVLGGDEV